MFTVSNLIQSALDYLDEAATFFSATGALRSRGPAPRKIVGYRNYREDPTNGTWTRQRRRKAERYAAKVARKNANGHYAKMRVSS